MDTLTDFVILIGPNSIFAITIIGMWLTITAVYVPGTGIPEAAAFISLSLAAVGLAVLPVGVFGLLLLIAALLSFVLLIFMPRYWHLIILGAVFQLAGSFFLFQAPDRPALWLILLLNAAALAYHQLILRPGLSIQGKPGQHEAEALIGQEAEVISMIDPVGAVRVHGELWRARATRVIMTGKTVQITGYSGLELHVTEKDRPE